MRSPSQPLSSTSGQKTHLVGYIVRQMRFSTHGAAVRFLLSGPYDRLCEFSIDGEITLRQGAEVLTLSGAIPGATFAPRELAPLLTLLGTTIEEVDVRMRPYEVRLSFTGGWEVMVGVDEYDYPVWQLRTEGTSEL